MVCNAFQEASATNNNIASACINQISINKSTVWGVQRGLEHGYVKSPSSERKRFGYRVTTLQKSDFNHLFDAKSLATAS